MKKNTGNIVIGGLFILFGLLYLGGIFNFLPLIDIKSTGIVIGALLLSIVSLVYKNFVGGFFFLGIFVSRMLEFLPSPYDNMFDISFWNIIVLAVFFGIGMQAIFGRRRKKHYYDERLGGRV